MSFIFRPSARRKYGRLAGRFPVAMVIGSLVVVSFVEIILYSKLSIILRLIFIFGTLTAPLWDLLFFFRLHGNILIF